MVQKKKVATTTKSTAKKSAASATKNTVAKKAVKAATKPKAASPAKSTAKTATKKTTAKPAAAAKPAAKKTAAAPAKKRVVAKKTATVAASKTAAPAKAKAAKAVKKPTASAAAPVKTKRPTASANPPSSVAAAAGKKAQAPAVAAKAAPSPARATAALAKPTGQKLTAAPGKQAAKQTPATPKEMAQKVAAARQQAAAQSAAQKKSVSQRHGFKTNEFIVYPAHGVGRIVGIEEQEIAGMSLELFVITFDKDKLTLRVPTGKLESVGMRKLAEDDVVKKAMEILKGRARIKRTMWSRRAQEYIAKINSGDLISIAEVVRDLYRSEAQPEQSYSERQLYEDALDRMAREVAAVEKLDDRGAIQRITDVLAKSARGRRAAEQGGSDEEIQAA